MGESLRFHPHVVKDLRKATAWYDKISIELGNGFRAAVDAKLNEIEANPSGYARAFDDLSFSRLKRFPYLILFCAASEQTLILGVFHTASDPRKWQRRIPRS